VGVNPLVANNYFGPAPTNTDQRTFTFRADHRFGNRDWVFGRYSRGQWDQMNRRAFNTAGNPITSDNLWNRETYYERSNTEMISWTHTFSPTFFNELLVTGTRTRMDVLTGDPTQCYDCALGLPNPFGVNQWPGLYDLGFNSKMLFETQNGTGFYAFYGILDDNATKIIGKHELQFGFHFRYDQMNLLPQQQHDADADQRDAPDDSVQPRLLRARLLHVLPPACDYVAHPLLRAALDTAKVTARGRGRLGAFGQWRVGFGQRRWPAAGGGGRSGPTFRQPGPCPTQTI
jgi:hypothetical protein